MFWPKKYVIEHQTFNIVFPHSHKMYIWIESDSLFKTSKGKSQNIRNIKSQFIIRARKAKNAIKYREQITNKLFCSQAGCEYVKQHSQAKQGQVESIQLDRCF